MTVRKLLVFCNRHATGMPTAYQSYVSLLSDSDSDNDDDVQLQAAVTASLLDSQ